MSGDHSTPAVTPTDTPAIAAPNPCRYPCCPKSGGTGSVAPSLWVADSATASRVSARSRPFGHRGLGASGEEVLRLLTHPIRSVSPATRLPISGAGSLGGGAVGLPRSPTHWTLKRPHQCAYVHLLNRVVGVSREPDSPRLRRCCPSCARPLGLTPSLPGASAFRIGTQPGAPTTVPSSSACAADSAGRSPTALLGLGSLQSPAAGVGRLGSLTWGVGLASLTARLALGLIGPQAGSLPTAPLAPLVLARWKQQPAFLPDPPSGCCWCSLSLTPYIY